MKHTLKSLLVFKIFIAFIGTLTMFSHSHNMRQLDTMGVTIRYWLRWTQEPELHYPLIPAVLNAGDQYGLAMMELPILNLLTAPFFFFGFEEGRILARVFSILLILGLVFWHHKIWKEYSVLGLKVEWASWLLLIYSLTALYLDRYMPDFLAFILASIALGLSWEKRRLMPSILLASLALLIKPPVVCVFALLFVKRPKEIINHSLSWILPSIIICFIYYTFVLSAIGQLTDFQGAFAIGLRDPIEAYIGFFSTPDLALKIISKYIFSAHTFFILIAWLIYKCLKKERHVGHSLFSIMIVQYLFAIFLVGNAGYHHNYYFIGSSFVAVLILKDFLDHASKRWVIAILVLLSVYTIERGYYTLRIFSEEHLFKQCSEINRHIPKDVLKVNTIPLFYAHLGTCLGKIQGSNQSEYAVYFKNEEPSFENRTLLLETRDLLLFKEGPQQFFELHDHHQTDFEP